jgi:hypothetical protein
LALKILAGYKRYQPVLQILVNYHQAAPLSESERVMLSEWLGESEWNSELFDDLSNPTVYEKKKGGKFKTRRLSKHCQQKWRF